MLTLFRKKRIVQYTGNAAAYLEKTLTSEALPIKSKKESVTKFKLQTDQGCIVPACRHDAVKQQVAPPPIFPSGRVKYSRRASDSEVSLPDDKYDLAAIAAVMQSYHTSVATPTFLQALDQATNKTFVDILTAYIRQKDLRDSQVYKAARIDRRLFSKIISDRQYKPSKDTAIALAIALELTLEQTNDLLSRAGYTLSHSNKRDVIIEYFLHERIYHLDDINLVLFNLDQKIIGR